MNEIDNKKLYESDEVVGKYAANTTRARSLNIPEKIFIDRFDIKNKDILVLGSGIGRVPVNLLLYGNRVKGIDRSEKLNEIANKNFPNSKFQDLILEWGDATDLKNISDESYDAAFFPMNAIDYINPLEMREKAIIEAKKKVKKGGILAFSSHNKLAYIFSNKVSVRNRQFKNILKPYHFTKENVVGGGYIFKGNPDYVIKSTEKLTGLKFVGFTCDVRNKLDKLFAKKLWLAKFIFPYILYIFRKD